MVLWLFPLNHYKKSQSVGNGIVTASSPFFCVTTVKHFFCLLFNWDTTWYPQILLLSLPKGAARVLSSLCTSSSWGQAQCLLGEEKKRERRGKRKDALLSPKRGSAAKAWESPQEVICFQRCWDRDGCFCWRERQWCPGELASLLYREGCRGAALAGTPYPHIAGHQQNRLLLQATAELVPASTLSWQSSAETMSANYQKSVGMKLREISASICNSWCP